MRQYLAGKIRNIALAGHGGSGKTALAEALLFKAGEIDRLGNNTLDFDPEEIKRRGSLSTTLYPFAWGSVKINLLDTPGQLDFAGGVYEGIRAAESVLVVVSGRSGVSYGTEKAYNMAMEMGKSRIFFVSKLDADHADFYKVLGELKATFGPSVCPLVVPFTGDDGTVECYINLVENKAYAYGEKGEPKEVTMPDFGHRLDGLTTAISEAVAETSEEMFEKYFSGEPFTRDELIAGIHTGVKKGDITPVLCGSGTNLAGVDMLLDSIVDHLPSAWDCGGETATTADGEKVEIACTDEAPLAAFVFKTVADPFVGKLSYVKVVSGKLSSEISPVNARTGQQERLSKIIYIKGKNQEETAFLTAGDIGALTKLGDTITSDTLCDPGKILSFDPISFPKPTLQMAIKVQKKGDEGKVAQGLFRLIEEDPTIRFEQNNETRQQLLSGLGEQHLDVITSRLKNKFAVGIDLVKPRVAYRETLRKKVKVEGKHKKQTGGHGQFGHVWIEFEPHDGDELIFETNVFGGSVPKNFFPAVQKGLEDSVSRGTIAGYPVVGIKATLLDGSYHPVDSSEMAFKMAASLAYRAGMAQATPVLLEPIGNLKVTVPDTYTGDIMGELNKRRGRVLGMNPTDDGGQEVEGEVPMSEMHDFTTYLRSLTQGRGSYIFEFERYEQLPANLENAVIEDAKRMMEEE